MYMAPGKVRFMLRSQTNQRVEYYRKHVSPQRVSGFESLGWNEDFVAAHGCTLVDATGRHFLDMSGCFGAVAVGHHHPALDAALVKLLSSRQPCTLPFGIPDKVGELAARLCALADCRVEKAYFATVEQKASRPP